MQNAIINAMKCMRAIKDRIARPVYQLANHHNQPLYPHDVSTGEIIGTTHLSASHNVAINQVINQSIRLNILYTRTMYQPGKSSVRDLQSPVSPSQLGGRHSNQIVTIPMIALDFSGTTHLSASHNVAINQVINQSIRLNIIISADFTTSITAMSTLKAVKSAQFVPSTADSTSTDFSQGTETHGLGYQISPGFLNHGRILLGAEIC
ncbi:KH domain-containing protein-like [Dorcoceras hygrometricum]|uniref:KH domain-containing protein-like n=1 Tax=Dorcoceras hygrometricum TaxID=472368 RepID=A0A2Z7AXV0_9LAMI|nr:KH domain-containing protein-like [Dorcoceras hygrometricum]